MKCNCNQNYNGNSLYNNESNDAFNGNGGFSYRNCCCRPASFVAYTTDNTEPTPETTKDCPANLTLNTIAFSSGAISAKAGSSKIFITQPGLYQVSYVIIAKKKAPKDGGSPAPRESEPTPEPSHTPKRPEPPKKCIFTSFIAENCTQLACKTSTEDSCKDGTTILSAVDMFSVSCKDLPTTLSLAVTTSCSTFIFNYYVTINKICPENVNTDLATPGYIYGLPCCAGSFMGYENYAVPYNNGANGNYNTGNNNCRGNNQWNCGNNRRSNGGCSNGCNNGCNYRCHNSCNC